MRSDAEYWHVVVAAADSLYHLYVCLNVILRFGYSRWGEIVGADVYCHDIGLALVVVEGSGGKLVVELCVACLHVHSRLLFLVAPVSHHAVA